MLTRRVSSLLFSSLLLLFLAVPSFAAEQMQMDPGRNVDQMKFGPVPGLPSCATGAVQSGDPSKGPSVIASKIASGCVIPWHWHTPTEQLILVSGTAKAEMKDGPAITMRAGGFAMMPAKHVHQFTCVDTCLLYVQSDTAFDIHYVDGDGKEIAPAAALK